jgi:hypothetical protein
MAGSRSPESAAVLILGSDVPTATSFVRTPPGQSAYETQTTPAWVRPNHIVVTFPC